MARKLKIKLKPGKVKIKLKSEDALLPPGSEEMTKLLGATLASAVASVHGVNRLPAAREVPGIACPPNRALARKPG